MNERLIVAQGDAFERGRVIGERSSERIRKVLRAQEQADVDKDGLTLHDWLGQAEAFMPCIKEHAAETLTEMEGVAAGSGLAFDDILLLSCVYEKHMGKGAEHCTAFAAAGAATATGELICGQNNDEAVEPWVGGTMDVVIHHRDESGLETLLYTHPGIPAYMGMNSAGLCVMWMYIDNGERGPGVPTCVLIRELLRHATLEDAVAYLKATPRAVPNNFLLAHRTDGICNVEFSPRQFWPVRDDLVLCHANHILNPSMAVDDVSRGDENGTTRSRFERMSRLVEEHRGRIDVAVGRQMLSDHGNAPRSICCHPREGTDQPGKTLASMVFQPATGTMHIAFGNGCETPARQFTLATRTAASVA